MAKETNGSVTAGALANLPSNFEVAADSGFPPDGKHRRGAAQRRF